MIDDLFNIISLSSISRVKLILVLAICLMNGPMTHSDEFPYFSIPDKPAADVVGYVRDHSKDTKEIRVLPVMSNLRAVRQADGSIRVSLTANQFPANRSAWLRSSVAQAIPTVRNNAIVGAIPLKDVEFTLLIDDREFQSTRISGRIFGSTTIGFTISSEYPDILGKIINDTYSIRVSYSARLADYSGLNLEFNRTDIADAYTSALKEVVHKVERSGARILFFDWSKTVAKHSTTVKTESSVDSSTRSSLHLVLVDERPDMLERLNGYLGLVEMTEEDCVRRHEISLAAARRAGDAATAFAYGTYIEAIRLKDPVGEVNALKAVAALSQGNVLEFLANGMAFGKAKGSQEMTYFASNSASVSSELNQNIKEVIIRTSFAEIIAVVEPKRFDTE